MKTIITTYLLTLSLSCMSYDSFVQKRPHLYEASIKVLLAAYPGLSQVVSEIDCKNVQLVQVKSKEDFVPNNLKTKTFYTNSGIYKFSYVCNDIEINVALEDSLGKISDNWY